MPDGIDTRVQAMQAARRDSVLDGATAQSERDELVSSDHAMLASSE
jgi:hypothetical protein